MLKIIKLSCFLLEDVYNNIIVSNNVMNNVEGIVIQHKWGTNVTIKDNTLIHWTFTSAPSQTTPFFYWQSETSDRPHDGNTYVEGNIIHDIPSSSARLGRIFASLGANGGICYMLNNKIPEAANILSQPANCVCSPYSNKPTYVGQIGDIITKSNPVAGQSLGWICTTSFVNGSGGTWTALPNL